MPPTTVLHDYYAILGIPQSADSATIRSAYKRLALVKHPDRRKNEPKATGEFQLLNDAYEQLYDVAKRREYDRIYESRILPQNIKNQKIAELDRELRQLKDERRGHEISLYNANKDLIRLSVERDSLKGEKERIMREKATEETWWFYICSFMPGRAAEFTRQKQRRENMMISIIGKRCAKDLDIDLKLKDVQALKEKIQSLSSKEITIEAERRRVVQNWREMCCEQEMLRRSGHFHGSNI